MSTAIRRHRRRLDRPSNTLTLIAVFVTAVFAVPVVWMFVGSIRPREEIFGSLYPLSWDIILPSRVTFDNYVSLVTGSFGRSILNSLLVCLISVLIGTLVCAMAAYAVAVLNFPGKGAVFTVIVISFLVPFEAIAIPLSQLFTDWGLANTLIGLVLPGIGNGLAIFNLRQHFLSIPSSYREAAHLDGASEPRVFASIYLPLGGGSLVNSALLIFLGQWNSFLWPLLVVSESDRQLAPVALAQAFGEHSSNFGEHFAGAVILSLIPAVLMYTLQRSFGGLSISDGEK
ncbi:lactose ABC transporter permease [Microbacterium nanhaiense]|uniref:Lactose ABC transporter permease n=1 Tax=Microbacterium nanhaiense TaxID=1301026 RepID=A0ABQ2N3F6_9MICO|nr:carbohydrate ABC transporter permease [Microbacterium nanhaiense]GGO64831.1 lactose ABC transporter permease [Microbacterium nanhaiense]